MFSTLEEEAAKTRDATAEAAKWKFAHEMLTADLESIKKDVQILEEELARSTTETRKIENELEVCLIKQKHSSSLLIFLMGDLIRNQIMLCSRRRMK